MVEGSTKWSPGEREIVTSEAEKGAESSSAFLRASIKFVKGSVGDPALLWSDLPSLITDYRFVTNNSRVPGGARLLGRHSPI